METLESETLKAYACMKLKANKRRNNHKTGTIKWKLQRNDKVLVRCQPTSDVARGVTGKFQCPFEGPLLISKIIPPSMYEVSDCRGGSRGKFNLSCLKPYLESVGLD
jgi:hypothetical protein